MMFKNAYHKSHHKMQDLSDASDGRIAPCMGIAVHGDGGLAVICRRRRDLRVMRRFADICDDGVPEGAACNAFAVLASIIGNRSWDFLYLRFSIANPPDVVNKPTSGGFCLLSVLTGSFYIPQGLL